MATLRIIMGTLFLVVTLVSIGQNQWTEAFTRPSGKAFMIWMRLSFIKIQKMVGYKIPIIGLTLQQVKTAMKWEASQNIWTHILKNPRGIHAIEVLDGQKRVYFGQFNWCCI